ncbi:PROTEIN E3 ubiquitin-protein ligase UNKL-like protein [Dinothrombium tinctorium]|uniref:PROTEIN E3 ubiquitin-protein ligase UNKL-like protein n=1 Tax=Dinothrombium tinctorium TaxID=1965070 RepID=A0A3S3NY40_9ACAR|nr:PROTEIN E3 ubiquitin-protein ligase UNKL-like protein [Dinothrombium tinctorium]
MPSTTESKANNLLPTQTEKPLHYTYLKEFRVEQCQQFLQHKCTQHKPFTCFCWHFMNQRRRRPVRRRDGTFNYSPDLYCSKYDETTGICPDGDECAYLHRTAGDTERRYHLRYYKTGICVYDTDSRGYCVKNGPHCAFAHGIHDLRNPVYDIRELQAMESGGGIGLSEVGTGENSSIGSLVAPNSLDKERNAMNDDPRWQDTSYVLANYKTELCKRPPRLCRQGYACPQFHNNKDRRRSPKKFKYRSTPCPNVKQGDEWGDPANCESGDSCSYCHTRTEQQFHPEIYKSTKCNDMQQTSYCPRGPFCAFAHVDKEISAARDVNMDNNTDFAALLSNALPQTTASSGNTNSTTSTTASTTTTATTLATASNAATNHTFSNNNTSSTSIAISRPSQTQLQEAVKSAATVASSLPDQFATSFDSARFASQTLQHQIFQREQTPPVTSIGPGPGPIARPRSYSTSNSNATLPMPGSSFGGGPTESLLSSYLKISSVVEDKNTVGINGPSSSGLKAGTSSLFTGNISPLFGGLTGNRESGNNCLSLFGAPGYPTTADTVESVVGSALEDLNLDDIHLEASLEKELGPNSQPGGNGGLGDTDANSVNCLGRSLVGSTPPVNIPGARLEGHRSSIANLNSPPIGASPLTSLGAQSTSYTVSPFARTPLNAHGTSVSSVTSSLYDFNSGPNLSPSSSNTQAAGNSSNMLQSAASLFQRLREELQRLREEVALQKRKTATMEEAYNVWKKEAEDATRRESLARQQLDEALTKIKQLEQAEHVRTANSFLQLRMQDIENMSLDQLHLLQQQLKSNAECIDKISE